MFSIPNLGLSIKNGFIFIISISAILTFISYLNNNLDHPVTKEINENEYKLPTTEYIILYLSRFVHFISTLSVLLLPYIFKPNLYLYFVFVIFVCIAVTSWILVKECPFSIHEKQILNKKYVNGDSNLEPYLILTIPSTFLFLFYYMYRINLVFILFRIFQHYYLPKSKIPEAIRM
jgi:hypothetical protein